MMKSRMKSVLFVLAAAVTSLYHPADCFAQLRPQAESSNYGKHGLTEVLAEQLIRNRDTDALLRGADGYRAHPDSEIDREALLHIFALPHDSFQFDRESASGISLRNHALSILVESPKDVQQRWVKANEIFAEQELQSALRSGKH